MKAVSIIVGALAAFATAAPTKEVETRGNFDLGLLNNLNSFNNQNIQYLGVLNSLDLALLAQLGSVNNFNVLSFQGLFQNNVFDLNSILQLQQLQLLLQFGQLGVFNGFDLSSLVLSNVNLGLINGIGSFGFDSLIDQSLIPGISSVASQNFFIGKKD